MTRFVAEQISHRKKAQSQTYTNAELRKNMVRPATSCRARRCRILRALVPASLRSPPRPSPPLSHPFPQAIFKATGVHPELEQRAASAAEETPGLPPEDPDRPHVFMDFSADGASLGTIVVEVFQDLVPASAKEFILRVTGAGAGRAGFISYENTRVHKIVDGVRVEGGRASSSAAPGASPGVPPEAARRHLSHVDAGVVSLSLRSSEFSVTLGPCAHVDDTFQVVGRVVRGRDALSALSATETDADCAPTRNVVVAACGTTGAAGSDRAGGEVAAELRAARAAEAAARAAKERGETRAETGARLARESEALGAGIKRSLADGLRREDEKRVKSGTRAGGGGGMMGALLGDVPSDSSDEDEGSDGE